jgi:hypothetical protein
MADESKRQFFLQIFWDAIIFFLNIFVHFFFILRTFNRRTIKPMLPSMKFQNGGQIQDDAKMFLSFETCKFNNFFKFLQDCLNLTNCFWSLVASVEWNFFFLKIQNGRKIQYGRFFAQKFMIFWSLVATLEWNVLIFGSVVLLALFLFFFNVFSFFTY